MVFMILGGVRVGLPNSPKNLDPSQDGSRFLRLYIHAVCPGLEENRVQQIDEGP